MLPNYVDAQTVAMIAPRRPLVRGFAATRILAEVDLLMRAIVLLLLGGGLVWLVWRNSGLSRAESPVLETEAPGYLLPVEVAAGVPENTSVAVPAAVESVAIVPRSNSTTEQTAPAPTRSPDRVLEIAVASELVHHPEKLGQYLQTRGRDLPTAQRHFALAFAQLATSSLEESREAARFARATDGLSPTEVALLDQLRVVSDQRPVPASVLRDAPMVQAASMAWLARDGERALASGHHRDAARVFSDLLLEEVQAPWNADAETLRRWSALLARAQARYQWDRTADWPAVDVKVEKGDSLISIRKRVLEGHPELLICTGQIERANGIQGIAIQPGQVLRVPVTRARVLVDLEARWVFYLFGDVVAAAWEAGIGKTGSETRPGQYTVGEKRTEPMWFPQGRDPVPFGDPANPLGTRWISWLNPDGSASRLGFHGTNDPESVGQDRSEGCIRMRNRDVQELFEILPKGASITVRP